MARHEKFITVMDLAGILNVSRATAYRLVHEGHFHSAKFGSSVRISILSVEAYVNRKFAEFSCENGVPLDE
ncbi:MAG: helix-turn-helix domain-containing protein [Syntrophobacteraceae bacterium]